MSKKAWTRPKNRVCSDCETPIRSDNKGGRCRRCALAHLNANPAFTEKRLAAAAASKRTPEHRERMREAGRRSIAARKADPEKLAVLQRSAAAARAYLAANPLSAERKAEVCAVVARKLSEQRLRWCPPAYRDQHRANIRKGLTLAQSQEVIRADIAKAERDRLAALTPLERQLERLRAGAKLIERHPMPTREHGFTLGGVASGQL